MANRLWRRFKPCNGITNASNTSIDTGIKAQDNMEVYVRVMAKTDSFYLLQSRETSGATIYGISGSQTGNTITSFGLTSGITRTTGHIYTIKLTIVNRATTLYVKDETDGTENTKTGTTTYTFPSPTTMKLFGDASKITSGTTIYRAYIKLNGVMAWDMYPCFDSLDNNKPVAYDNVTHTGFIPSAGSITGGYLIQPIAYAQTNGSACADTDLLLNGSEKWTMKFASLKSELATPVAGSLNGGTAYTARNNFCVTYTTAFSPHAYSIYVDGNAGSTNNSWNGGLATDKAWHTLEYLGNVNTAPKLDGVAMTRMESTPRVAVTPSVPWRLFGRATTAKGQGTLSQDGVAIARFTGDTWDYLPVRLGTTVELLDLVSWSFAKRTGTFTAGADIEIGFQREQYLIARPTYPVGLKELTPSDTTRFPATLNDMGTFVLDGTESWTIHASLAGLAFHSEAGFKIQASAPYLAFCGRYEAKINTTAGSISVGECCGQALNATVTMGRFCVRDAEFTNLTALREKLSANPLEILYPLATSDGSVWKAVNIGTDRNGYLCVKKGTLSTSAPVGTVVEAKGMTGSVGDFLHNPLRFFNVVRRQYGKNLCPVSTISPSYWSQYNADITAIIQSLPNGVYTISADFTLTSRESTTDGSMCGILVEYEGGIRQRFEQWENSTAGATRHLDLTLTVTDAVKRNTWFGTYGCGNNSVGATGSADVTHIQIENGDTGTSYEPYHNKVSFNLERRN